MQHPVCAWGSQDGLDAEQKKNGSGLWVILKDQKGKANLPLLHLSLLRQEKNRNKPIPVADLQPVQITVQTAVERAVQMIGLTGIQTVIQSVIHSASAGSKALAA